VLSALTDSDKAYTLMAYNGLKQRALMLNGVGMGDAQMKKVQLIKRLTNTSHNLQVMACNALKEFLASERAREEEARLENERQQKEKERILKRIMDSNCRMMGIGFRQSFQFMDECIAAEIAKMSKQRGIMRRIVDSNVRIMSQGFNKLIESHKANQALLKDKLKFVLASLTDSDKSFTLMAYNGLKQRALMLSGVGMGDAQVKKIQLLKRLTNSGHNLQVMAANALQAFLASERAREQSEKLEHERQQKEKDRILKRIMDSNCRMMGIGFRQAFQWMETQREAEIAFMKKQRGIMRRIVDSNARLMSMGYNKLVEAHKLRNQMIQDKLRFVLKSLTDKDAAFTIQAYNGLRENQRVQNGVGLTNALASKMQLIKRLTNQGYNMQVMACNALQEFLSSERSREESARVEQERQQKEKDRILKRIMDSNCRMMGMGFRQAFQWTQSEIDRERILAAKQRGIMRRIVDANTRLSGMAMNALQAHLASCRQTDASNAGICNMRSGMMNSLIKNRDGHERRQLKSGLDILTKFNHLQNTKQTIIKN
jgi:hypothetical protein